MKCSVTYCRHSGFHVRTQAHDLLFDYIGGDVPASEGLPAIALASHVHGDHYLPQIAHMADECVLGEGIPPFAGAHVMRPGDALMLRGAEILAFGSTDAGVSFLVRSGGVNIFHAGDLNFWHWRAESTDDEVRAARRDFDNVLDTLEGIDVDAAFFPVDGRLGADCGEGARMYIERVHPKVLIPMHWWDKPEIAQAFASAENGQTTRVIAMTDPKKPLELY